MVEASVLMDTEQEPTLAMVTDLLEATLRSSTIGLAVLEGTVTVDGHNPDAVVAVLNFLVAQAHTHDEVLRVLAAKVQDLENT